MNKTLTRFLSSLVLFFTLGMIGYAQAPSHPPYVSLSLPEGKKLYEAYQDWEAGKYLFTNTSENEEIEDNEEFFISRIKPKTRFSYQNTQVNKEISPDRKMMFWCPVGVSTDAVGKWNAIPSYFFNSEAFSFWSYVDFYGNWSGTFFRVPAAFTDICHKNGVKTSTTFPVAWGAGVGLENETYGKVIDAMATGGADKFLKFLRYYGIDGIGWNSEFNFEDNLHTKLKNLLSDSYAKKDEANWPVFNNNWYNFIGNTGGIYNPEELNENNQDWFQYNDHPTSDAFFLNYNWTANRLARSQKTATELGRSSYDIYAGMDIEGRNYTKWGILKDYNVSIGFWGGHSHNEIFSSKGENGSDPLIMQKTYQLIGENMFTGSSYNPVNTPPVKDVLRHSSKATDFHGVSKFVSARSTLHSEDLSKEPFVSYFNLGNGLFFNVNGEKKSENEWYNLGIQDYMPTWRWWKTTKFMGREEVDVKTGGIKPELTWDDAWFGGSCLSITGETDLEYLHLFKTRYPLQEGDELLIRYKLNSGTGKINWSCLAEDEDTSYGLAKDLSLDSHGSWIEEKVVVGNGLKNLKMAGKTLAMIALKFEATSADFKLLIGEISLTRGKSTTPNAPTIRKTKILSRNYKGIDFKVIYKMKDADPANPAAPIYNEDVNTWYYNIYMQQEGSEAFFCTATSSWAAYMVGALLDEKSTKDKIRIGVSAVSLDGKSESEISWSDYITLPQEDLVEGIEIDKAVIKKNEEFTIKFIDPNYPQAIKWEIRNAQTDEVVKELSNTKSINASLENEGVYNLFVYEEKTEAELAAEAKEKAEAKAEAEAKGETVAEEEIEKTKITKFFGLIQVSPKEVGAVPQIESLKANDSEEAISINKGEDVLFKYEARDADGKVSRGLNLNEKAFSISASQLGFNNISTFSLSFWVKANEYHHKDWGTQLLNIRSRTDKWPASDWGYVWSNLRRDEKLSFNLRKKSNSGTGFKLEEPLFKPGQWFHVCYVFDYEEANGGSKIIRVYVNGKGVFNSGNIPLNDIYDWKNDNSLMIGGPCHDRAGIYGLLDEFQLYNKALNDVEVLRSMKHFEQNEIPESLIGYWDFETDADENNFFISTGSDKTLKSALELYGDKNPVVQYEPSYKVGAPFIQGDNYEVKTHTLWETGGSIVEEAVNNENNTEGSVKVKYNDEKVFEAKLSLSNDWGTSTKLFSYVKVGNPQENKEPEVELPAKLDQVNSMVKASLYPNPFVNEINMQFTVGGTYSVVIVDINGQELWSREITVSENEFAKIELNVPQGIYFARIISAGKPINVFKIIKN